LSKGYFATSRGFLFQPISAASSSFWAVVTNAAVDITGVGIVAALEPINEPVNDARYVA
jgi:hypothetical protein